MNTQKFELATRFAIRAHAGQVRKGSGAPYICHPLAVASLVLEYGGTDAQAIAALLHDVIEDCDVKEAELKRRFGIAVSRIVRDCTDHFGPPNVKKSWHERKVAYLAHLENEAHRASLLVSAADKLHNARSILHDLRHRGPKTWKMFSADPTQVLWYYTSLVRIFKKRTTGKHTEFAILVAELSTAVDMLKRQQPKGNILPANRRL